MEKNVLQVEGMSCEHCVKAVEGAVGALSGVSKVSVDLAGKTVAVEHDSAQSSVAAIQEAIEEEGFTVISK